MKKKTSPTFIMHRLAASYYEKKVEKYGRLEDRIEMLCHRAKMKYEKEILELFVQIANSLKDEDPVMRLLPRLGEEIRNHVVHEEKALLCGTFGNVYWKISKCRGKAENCKKAIKAYEEALKVFTAEFPEPHRTIQRNLKLLLNICASIDDPSNFQSTASTRS